MMERVLHVYPQMNSAGTEAVIMNLYRNIDREKVQFDLLVMTEGESDERFRALGANVHYLPKTKNYKRDLVAFFKAHPEYKTVHTHTHREMGIVLGAAKRAGVPTRIAHSHNSRSDLPKLMKLYKLVSGWEMESSATHFLACSREAAEWLFPRKHRRAVVWNNAIDLDAFRFDPESREKYRAMLGIPSGAKVIAHVGRFADQKNHRFLIKLLNRLTDAGILAEDKLFATLDPTTRKFELPCGEEILLTDTVGFIRNLPHHLIRAFRSTLDEVCYADAILVVVDASDPESIAQVDVTRALIDELGASDKPVLFVYNKCILFTIRCIPL